ncbi:MAG: IS30 family transposase [Clostridia bacterium]|nr:IS30 family transposase [Clostridia bacterium]
MFTEERIRAFKHLTYTQRLQIETLIKTKLKKTEISKLVGCSLATLYLELKRGVCEQIKSSRDYVGEKVYRKFLTYSAEVAQRNYVLNSTAKGRPLKIGKDYEFVRYIENRVQKDKVSACAVLGEIKRLNMPFDTRISKTTLYRYIQIGIFNNIRLAPHKSKTYRRQVMKRAPRGVSIERRPLSVAERNSFGHWEMDCVCGSSLSTLLVLSERFTRKEIIFKMNNQKSDSVIRCLNSLERKFGSSFSTVFKSITVDNGSEFSDYIGLERSVFGRNKKRTTVFYCHPYCSWERGTNERLNREIRRLIPKGTDLSFITKDEVKRVETWVNRYPREVLNYDCSEVLFRKELENLSIFVA